MNDMRAVIIPRSDQINADSLLGGPITITITAVSIKPGTEQPVTISYDGDAGKPYRPCKSMARVMVQCWGPDANAYVGRSMTLYCDPTVTWGGMAVGGIRISHMSDIQGAQKMALTATKGSKKVFVVKPLVIQAEKSKITEWIERTLAPALIDADADKLQTIQQSKLYTAAIERGTAEERAQIERMATDALARIEAPSASEEDPFSATTDQDPEPTRAADFITAIAEKETRADLDKLLSGTAIRQAMAGWKTTHPALFKQVDDAVADRIIALEPAE